MIKVTIKVRKLTGKLSQMLLLLQHPRVKVSITLQKNRGQTGNGRRGADLRNMIGKLGRKFTGLNQRLEVLDVQALRQVGSQSQAVKPHPLVVRMRFFGRTCRGCLLLRCDNFLSFLLPRVNKNNVRIGRGAHGRRSLIRSLNSGSLFTVRVAWYIPSVVRPRRLIQMLIEGPTYPQLANVHDPPTKDFDKHACCVRSSPEAPSRLWQQRLCGSSTY